MTGSFASRSEFPGSVIVEQPEPAVMARVCLGLKCNAEKREADPNVGLAGENGRYPQVAFESASSQQRSLRLVDCAGMK